MNSTSNIERVQRILSNLTNLDKARELFSELNYIPAYNSVSPPDKEKDALADDPVVIAEYEGFNIIYLRLNSDNLLLTKERPIILKLLANHPSSLFLVSN